MSSDVFIACVHLLLVARHTKCVHVHRFLSSRSWMDTSSVSHGQVTTMGLADGNLGRLGLHHQGIWNVAWSTRNMFVEAYLDDDPNWPSDFLGWVETCWNPTFWVRVYQPWPGCTNLATTWEPTVISRCSGDSSDGRIKTLILPGKCPTHGQNGGFKWTIFQPPCFMTSFGRERWGQPFGIGDSRIVFCDTVLMTVIRVSFWPWLAGQLEWRAQPQRHGLSNFGQFQQHVGADQMFLSWCQKTKVVMVMLLCRYAFRLYWFPHMGLQKEWRYLVIQDWREFLRIPSGVAGYPKQSFTMNISAITDIIVKQSLAPCVRGKDM